MLWREQLFDPHSTYGSGLHGTLHGRFQRGSIGKLLSTPFPDCRLLPYGCQSFHGHWCACRWIIHSSCHAS